MQNVIKREIIIQSTRQRLYEAIANPQHVIKWFPTTIEGNYQIGEQPIFGFGEHGRNQLYIVDAKPHQYFAYRWVPGGNHFLGDVRSVATTLVEFHIEDLGNGTCKLILTETGFAALPAEIIEQSFQQNSNGWDFMLSRLVKYFEAD